jgi:MFS family permease
MEGRDMTHQDLLIVLAVLAGIGVLAALTYARSATRRAARGLRATTSAISGVVRTLIAAAVITGIQWAIVTNVHDWRVLLAVLAAPALLAGRTLARMFAVTEFVRGGYLR